jgi:hypothetical protein
LTHERPHDHAHDDGHGHAPGHSHEPEPGTQHNWHIHHPFGENGDEVAVEVGPWDGLLARWRFVVPAGYTGVTRWGVGPANGGPVETNLRGTAEGGPVQLVNGPEVIWFGGVEALSSRKSAYLVFKGDPPHYIAFGQAEDPEGPPGALEGISFGDHPTHPTLGGHPHAH